jgi:hypothetical protein
MKTLINEDGCTTHQHGESSLNITVPVLVNGTNVGDTLTELTESNFNFNIRIQELAGQVESLQLEIKNLQKSQIAQSIPVLATSEESNVAKNNKKLLTKPIVVSATETADTLTA